MIDLPRANETRIGPRRGVRDVRAHNRLAYLQEANRVLVEQLGGKPRRFSDAQRIRLARKAKVVGRRRLGQIATIVTADTLPRWFRILVAKKWTIARTNLVGRPPEIRNLKNSSSASRQSGPASISSSLTPMSAIIFT
jgi:hypothetical protein